VVERSSKRVYMSMWRRSWSQSIESEHWKRRKWSGGCGTWIT
jgi:hypothetical protein